MQKSFSKDKLASCHLLNELAKALQSVPELLIDYYGEIIEVLEETTSDKDLKVQHIARKAK